ncbi:MAG: trypsin-like peptidase domain-containing protein [Dehalococcoidia bacterium]
MAPVQKSTVLTRTDAELRRAFCGLKTRQDVAAVLEVSDKDLVYYLYRKKPTYRVFEIPKKGGGTRQITAPEGPIKILQHKLNQVLRAVYLPRRGVHGFCRKRIIKTNALVHQRQQLVLSIDLADFFPTIHFGRVRGMFSKAPYAIGVDAAQVLAQLCTWDGRLPQGAPTSPIVSNMICGKLDSELFTLARDSRCLYTRYADDITFSTSRRRFPKAILRFNDDEHGASKPEIGSAVAAVIETNGFLLNERKVRIRGRGQRQEVTGLTVNEFPNIQRWWVNHLRAMIHSWAAYGEETAQAIFETIPPETRKVGRNASSLRAAVLGSMSFLRMIKGPTDRVYINLHNRMVGLVGGLATILEVTTRERLESAMWVVETDRLEQGTAFMLEGHGLVTAAHVIEGAKCIEVFQTATPHVRLEAKVRRCDPKRDLAILKVDVTPKGVLMMAEKRSNIDQMVSFCGYPSYFSGATMRFTRARVTGKSLIEGIEHIAVDTPILSGNSGGPLLDDAFGVLGVVRRGVNPKEEEADVRESSAIAIRHIEGLPVLDGS